MANRAYLLAVNDRHITWSRRPRSEVLAEGMNEIPLFWASLFVQSDRQVDRHPDTSGEIKAENACVETAVAKRRLARRSRRVLELLDARSRELWSQWSRLIAGVRTTYLKTNTVEVRALDPQGFAAYWARLLRAFSHPSVATMRAAARRNGLEYRDGGIIWTGVEETLCKLAGADHIRRLPWFDKKLEQFDAEPEDEDHLSMYDQTFRAISPDDSLEEAMKKARMIKAAAAKKSRQLSD